MFLHFSAKKVECAKHQWIHLVGDQPESPHAFENFVVNARRRSTWVRVYNSLTLQSSYVPQPTEGRGRNRQAPPQKKNRGGGVGGAREQPTATKPPANTTRGGQTPHPEGTQDRTPKEAQGDHPTKTGNTKPGTAAHREKGHRNMQTHTTPKKKK